MTETCGSRGLVVGREGGRDGEQDITAKREREGGSSNGFSVGKMPFDAKRLLY